jgi:hydrogenase-4 component H
MRYPKLRELKEAIRSFFSKPYTSKFPYQPHKPYERFRGKPEYHEDDCVGCGACFQVCPAAAIEMNDREGKRLLTIHWDVCIACGQCQANCLTGEGIMLSQEFDLATTENREALKQEIAKELVFCGCCGEAIAPRDQVLWVAKKLGPLVFSNTTLMLAYLQQLNLALKEEPSLKRDDEFARSQRIRILCPRCRQQVVLKS